MRYEVGEVSKGSENMKGPPALGLHNTVDDGQCILVHIELWTYCVCVQVGV